MNFILGFFREGTRESSARLVGITSCFASILFAFTHNTNTETIIQTGAMFTNGLIALGLRKSPKEKTDGDSAPEDAGDHAG